MARRCCALRASACEPDSRYHRRVPVSRALVTGVLVLLLGGGLAWYLTHRVDSTPVQVAAPELERWTLIASDGTDPWVVGMKPPDSLTSRLLATAQARAGVPLVAPAHSAVPLVLRAEFDESLQGAFGIDSVQRMATDAGLTVDRAFEPVCLAHRTVRGAEGDAELYFVPFTSPAFDQLRVSLMPEHPEQAGIGMYDPGLLTPVLIVGATENRFDDWWPLRIDPARDCEAPVTNR